MSLVNILNPRLILIGGVAKSGDLFIDTAKEYLGGHLALKQQDCEVRAAELGEYAGAWGACCRVINILNSKERE